MVSLSVAMPLGLVAIRLALGPSPASLVAWTTQGTVPILEGLGIRLGAVSPGGAGPSESWSRSLLL